MRFLPFRFVGIVACVVCSDLHAYAVESSRVENSEALENLKNYDSVYESGFTVSGTWECKDMILMGRLYLDVTRHWKLTFGGDRVGYFMEVMDYEKPKYQPPEKGRFETEQPAQQGPGGNETLRITMRTKQWGYWGHDLSGNHYEDTVLAVTPEGEVTETGKMYDSSVFPPKDESLLPKRKTVLWSLGRFFSRQLDTIATVDESPDGRLLVSALGKKGERRIGRWELEIEPAAAWMVRKARFYRDTDPDRIELEMRNEGTVWSGAYCIPKEAVINYWGPINNTTETSRLTATELLTGGPERLTFEPAVDTFDEPLYSRAKQAVAENKTPTLTLHDYRVSPPSISEPFRPKRTQPLPVERRTGKRWFIALNLVAILILLTLLIVRSHRTRHGGLPGK